MSIIKDLLKSPMLIINQDFIPGQSSLSGRLSWGKILPRTLEDNTILLSLCLDDQTIQRFLHDQLEPTWVNLRGNYLNLEFPLLAFSESRDASILVEMKQGIFSRLVSERKSSRMIERPIVQNPFSFQLVSSFFSVLNKPRGDRNLRYLASLAYILAEHLIHLCWEQQEQEHQPGLIPQQLKRVKAYFDARVDQTVKLDDLAKELGVSPSYLCRCFKQSTGLTPFQYFTKLKMIKVSSLLDNTDMSIIQIGMEVGYDNPAHFSNSFKKYFGVSPRAYRKQAREGRTE